MKNGENVAAERLKADAVRFYENGIGFIAKARISPETYLYTDAKPIHEGTAIIYRGLLSALDAYFLMRGITREKLPNHIDEYRKLLRHHSVHNGKVLNAFNYAYNLLHVFGYYGRRKDEMSPRAITEGIEASRFVIEKLLNIKLRC